MFFKRILGVLSKPERIYLDVASSTPIDRRMQKTFPKLADEISGTNPHALHAEGIAAHRILETARKDIAAVLHAHPDEIIYTSGATESDNLALLGAISAYEKKGIAMSAITVMTSEFEHAAVSETLLSVAARGVNVVHIPSGAPIVDSQMIILPQGCAVLIVSVMYVNNEVGTVQPIRDIAKRLRAIRKHNAGVHVVFHCDATQAPVHYALDVTQLGIDLMTLGATKLYTTKGVGVLYKKRSVALEPIMHGGGQQYGLRPGTEPVVLIHHFAQALVYADRIRKRETLRVRSLQCYFEDLIHTTFPDARITAENAERSPHITHVTLKGFDSELLVIELDARGIAVSAKSACKNDTDGESAMVTKLYGTAYGAVRFSFGRMTTKRDVRVAVHALADVCAKYRPLEKA